jgi:hypothetical protein
MLRDVPNIFNAFAKEGFDPPICNRIRNVNTCVVALKWRATQRCLAISVACTRSLILSLSAFRSPWPSSAAAHNSHWSLLHLLILVASPAPHPMPHHLVVPLAATVAKAAYSRPPRGASSPSSSPIAVTPGFLKNKTRLIICVPRKSTHMPEWKRIKNNVII